MLLTLLPLSFCVLGIVGTLRALQTFPQDQKLGELPLEPSIPGEKKLLQWLVKAKKILYKQTLIPSHISNFSTIASLCST